LVKAAKKLQLTIVDDNGSNALQAALNESIPAEAWAALAKLREQEEQIFAPWFTNDEGLRDEIAYDEMRQYWTNRSVVLRERKAQLMTKLEKWGHLYPELRYEWPPKDHI